MAPPQRRHIVLEALRTLFLICSLGTSQALEDVKLKFAKDLWCNPSLVEYDGSYLAAIKTTSFKRIDGKTWWMNTLYMCEGSSSDMHGLKCRTYSPWRSKYTECKFDSRVRGGKVDVSGLGDVKVWVWPGRGVYSIFGRKPQRSSSSSSCTELIVYHQWLAQVVPAPGLPEDDPWNLAGKDPLPLLPGGDKHSYAEDADYVMEKNWMPFVWKDPKTKEEQLFVTYMVMPHMVYQVLPNGTSIHRWTTMDEQLMGKFQDFDVHGGPPVVYVPANKSPDGEPFFLGIMHHIERFDNGKVRLYRHFAYKAFAQPPFPVMAISDELPLVFNQTYKSRTAWVAFISGLFLTEDNNFLITYGSADIEARVLSISMEEMEELFTGKIQFRDITVPLPKSDHERRLRMLSGAEIKAARAAHEAATSLVAQARAQGGQLKQDGGEREVKEGGEAGTHAGVNLTHPQEAAHHHHRQLRNQHRLSRRGADDLRQHHHQLSPTKEGRGSEVTLDHVRKLQAAGGDTFITASHNQHSGKLGRWQRQQGSRLLHLSPSNPWVQRRLKQHRRAQQDEAAAGWA